MLHLILLTWLYTCIRDRCLEFEFGMIYLKNKNKLQCTPISHLQLRELHVMESVKL
jgi:hypothetical protein